jgi:hypothetical protein
MLLFYSNLRENDVRERAKATDYSLDFSVGIIVGYDEQKCGDRKTRHLRGSLWD